MTGRAGIYNLVDFTPKKRPKSDLNFCEGGVKVDESLDHMEDLGLAAGEHVAVQVHVQRLRVRRQRVISTR